MRGYVTISILHVDNAIVEDQFMVIARSNFCFREEYSLPTIILYLLSGLIYGWILQFAIESLFPYHLYLSYAECTLALQGFTFGWGNLSRKFAKRFASIFHSYKNKGERKKKNLTFKGFHIRGVLRGSISGGRGGPWTPRHSAIKVNFFSKE